MDIPNSLCFATRSVPEASCSVLCHHSYNSESNICGGIDVPKLETIDFIA